MSRHLEVSPHVEDPYLYEHLLEDVAPLDASNRRHVRPSRRGVIRLGTGLIATVLTPAAVGCVVEVSEDDIGVMAIGPEKLFFALAEMIAGDLILINNGGTQYIESIFRLIERNTGGEADSHEPGLWTLPEGDKMFRWDNLWAERAGEHFTELLMQGRVYSTESFRVD